MVFLPILDFLIIVLHILLGSTHEAFNITRESNWPTLYQSIKTVVTGFLFLYFMAKIGKVKYASIAGAILVFMGLDDWFQIHERLAEKYGAFLAPFLGIQDRFTWVVFYFPLGALLLGVIILICLQVKERAYYLGGLSLLVASYLLEIAESVGFASQYVAHLNSIEESVEMVAISLLAMGALKTGKRLVALRCCDSFKEP